MHMYLPLQSINWGSTLNCRFDSGVCYVNYFWVEGIHYNIVLWQVHFKLNFQYTQDYITHKYTWQDQIYIWAIFPMYSIMESACFIQKASALWEGK